MMTGNEERWRDLCEQAESERDPNKLRGLIEEIFALIEERQRHPARNLPANKGAKTQPGLGGV